MSEIKEEKYIVDVMEEDDNKTKYFYNKEFKTKLFVIHPLLKKAYSSFRNLLKKYRVIRKVGANAEEYYYKDVKILRITCFDRALRLYLNVKVSDDLIDYSDKEGYQDTKYLLIVNSEELINKGLEVIENALKENGVGLQLWYKEYNYVTDIALRSSWQVALTSQAGNFLDFATIDDANLLTDKEANNCIVYEESLSPIDRSVVSTISVGELSAAFSDKYYIDIDLLKKTKLVSEDATYLKVTNGGKCYHKIDVVANEYDEECLKMIILTGGNVVKLI